MTGIEVILLIIGVGFNCNCSRQRVESALALINRQEIEDMIADNEPIEIKCHFCNTAYNYSVEDLTNILKRSRK